MAKTKIANISRKSVEGYELRIDERSYYDDKENFVFSEKVFIVENKQATDIFKDGYEVNISVDDFDEDNSKLVIRTSTSDFDIVTAQEFNLRLGEAIDAIEEFQSLIDEYNYNEV